MLMPKAEVSQPSRLAATTAIVLLFFMSSTAIIGHSTGVQSPFESVEPCPMLEQLEFNGSAANASVHWQVDLGPRIPGSNASAALREGFKENLTQWSVEERTYTDDNVTFTNLIASLQPAQFNETTPRVVIVAHYDTREVADRDPDQNRTSEPILGANDGASGTAVLFELSRIIPTMNLDYEVELLWTDAEDVNRTPHRVFGAEQWVARQTPVDVSRTSAFIVVDMVGDADLQLTHTWPGSNALWSTISPLATALGMVENESDCYGINGTGTFDMKTSIGVTDDHVPAHNIGIPAIDLIDIQYGEGALPFEGYWHTHEDTPDKVSAESLQTVGRLVELGLRTNAWVTQNAPLPPSPEVEDQTSTSNAVSSTESEIETLPLLGTIALSLTIIACGLIAFLNMWVGRLKRSI
ncbi:MAG: hypothetical protein CMA63_01795 [Euryarchaeota archaeon]|nr:hypothetical protein [Euryarchaeota archaeon]|tara:strand:- start:5201 stop:6430 length:1230 start_codon:yes stop_codon:yes gene_type:complete